MKILVNDYAGHPFQYELASELVSRGHEVHHMYCSTTVTPQANFNDPNVITDAISTGRTFSKYDLRKRIIDELRYGWRSVRLARRVKPDRLITSNMPLLSLLVMWIWATLSRTRWILWLQDIQTGIAQLVIGERRVATRVLGSLERWLIRRAWRVVAVSDEFRSEAIRLGATAERVTVIENWAPLNDLPQRPRRNDWSERYHLHERFVFLYSGTLGRKHNPELLLELADQFAEDPDVRVVVVSEGVGADWLHEQDAAQHRPNLVLLPFQPFEELPDVFGSADVVVALLDPAAGMFSVPSKVLSYLCAGRAILGALPEQNAAARLIGERASAGLVVAPGDADDLVTAAHKLRADQTLRGSLGRNGRHYAEATFDRSVIGDRFEALLELKGDTL